MKTLQIGVIIGGARPQQKVNTSHGRDIFDALTELGHTAKQYVLSNPESYRELLADYAAGKLDLVFNNAAGKRGGDGTVEGFLETAGIPFVGSDTHATACAFDKLTTKRLVEAVGVPTSPSITVEQESYSLERVLQETEKLGYPVVVKAVRGSDSLGISLVREGSEMEKALLLAFEQDDSVLVESFIDRSSDLTCMVLGTGASAEALIPAESIFEGDIYTDEVADLTETRIPEVDPEIVKKVQEYSVAAHRALNCSDYSRSDFLVDKQGNIFFLELNAHAGLGKDSCTMFITETSKGWTHTDTIGEILKAALTRQKLFSS